MTVSEKSRWLILIVLSSALFLIVIDMTVLYTALPSLDRDLGTSASEKLWIINAYALVVAGPLPGLGPLGDPVGHKGMVTARLCAVGAAPQALSLPAAKAAATWDGTRWARSRSWSGWSVLPTRSRSSPRRRPPSWRPRRRR